MEIQIFIVFFCILLFTIIFFFNTSTFLGFAISIFAILSVLLLIFMIKRNIELGKKSGTTMREKMPLHITNVDVGGVFKLSNIEGEDLELKVLKKHLYQEGDFYWYELECDNGGEEKIWVEVEDDDETIVTVVIKKIEFSSLKITREKLKAIDEDEEGNVFFEGSVYTYEESDEAIFYRNCDDKNPQKVYYWDFKAGQYYLTVERWGENEHQCFLSKIVKPSQITVYSNSTEE